MKQTKDKGIIWKAALCLLFAVFLVGMVLSMTIASRKGSKVVDREYYSHGLHYNETSKNSGQETAGWSISSAIVDGQVLFRLFDASGKPLAGASATFLATPDGNNTAQKLTLNETAPGVYSATYPSGTLNELRGILRVARGSAVMQNKVVIFK